MYKTTATVVILFVFCHELLMSFLMCNITQNKKLGRGGGDYRSIMKPPLLQRIFGKFTLYP